MIEVAYVCHSDRGKRRVPVEQLPVAKARLVDAYTHTGSISDAARAAGVCRDTVRRWRGEDAVLLAAMVQIDAQWDGSRGVRRCMLCGCDKPNSEFSPRPDNRSVRRACLACRAEQGRARYERHRREAWFKFKASRARARARRLGVPFDLDAEYLASVWTGRCPISGVELLRFGNRADDRMAELDRIRPAEGYARGNVAFLARRMNRLKDNISLAEARRLLAWLEEVSR